jgi:hypothetical protein
MWKLPFNKFISRGHLDSLVHTSCKFTQMQMLQQLNSYKGESKYKYNIWTIK